MLENQIAAMDSLLPGPGDRIASSALMVFSGKGGGFHPRLARTPDSALNSFWGRAPASIHDEEGSEQWKIRLGVRSLP